MPIDILSEPRILLGNDPVFKWSFLAMNGGAALSSAALNSPQSAKGT